MSTGAFQVAAQLALCAIATYLFARRLPQRDDFALRAGVALAVLSVAYVVVVTLGYTLYPTLTDDLSFAAAVGMFSLVIAAFTGGVRTLWDAPFWTALFCASGGYLVQSIVLGLDRILHITGLVSGGFVESGAVPAMDVLSLTACAAVTLVALYLAYARDLRRDGLLGVNNPVMFFAVLVTMVVALVLDLAIKDVITYDMPQRYRVILSVVYLAVCVFILVAEFEVIYNQSLKASMSLMEHTVAEQRRQFELSRETISAVNRRVHDIRRHVAGILSTDVPSADQLRQVLREVDVYDSAIRTGNAALDVVLTEKSLLCRNRGVTLSCIADGSAVAHLPAPELYALFGNALDLAIESVRALDDPTRRSIALNVRAQLGMALVSVEHHAAGQAAPDSSLALEGLQQVVERHDGTLTRTVMDGVMHVDILLPLE